MKPRSPAPFAYAIDPDAGLAYGRLWGTVTGADMLALLAAVHDDPRWSNGFDAIWDCSLVRAHVVDEDDVPLLISEEASAGAGHDALVESALGADVVITRLLAALTRRRGKPTTVHSTLDEALTALGRDALPPSAEDLLANPQPWAAGTAPHST